MDKQLWSDEELAFAGKEGDTESINILIERYKTFVKKIVHSYFLVGGDKEDLAQEGIIGVFKAINDYKKTSKSSFKTFAYLCVKRNVLTAIRQSNRDKHKPLNNYISLTAEKDDNYITGEISVSSEVVDPEAEYINNESLSELKNEIKEILSPYEYEILKLYLEGYNYFEISLKLKKKQKVIDNAMQRSRKKLEKAVSKERKSLCHI